MTLYSIQNGSLTAQFNSFGAELTSVKDQTGFEYIWQANPEVWARHAPILFPIVGRLKDLQYSYDGNSYPLNQHGFARDSEFKLLQKSEHSITFLLSDSKQTLEGYPFRFQLMVQYTLEGNSLHQSFIVINRDQNMMPASFGAHPAFNVYGVSNYILVFECDETVSSLTLDDGLIANETRPGITEGKLHLDQNTFDRDALIFNDLTSQSVQLKHVKSDHSITVSFPEFPYLGIWAKPGAPFVCIEPWHGLADHRLHSGKMEDKTGMLWLQPGESIGKSFTITFSH